MKDIKVHQQFHEAIIKGDVKVVEALLNENNVTINTKYKFRTPLHAAAEHNQAEVIKALLRYNPDIDKSVTIKNRKESALHVACRNKCLEATKVLLDNSANINLQNDEKQTVVHIAVNFRNQSINILQLLLRYNPDVNKFDDVGYCPIHWACYYGLSEAVELLLKHKADADSFCTKSKETPFYTAASRYNLNICSLLVNYGADLRFTVASCDFCDDSVIKVLLLYDAELDIQNKQGGSKLKSINRILPVQLNQYKDEVERIKNVILTNNITLHGFLFMPTEKAINYVENKTLKKIFNYKAEYLENFSLYEDLMRHRYYSASDRKNLIISGKNCLRILTESVLFDECYEKICNMLNISDLEKLSILNEKIKEVNKSVIIGSDCHRHKRKKIRLDF